MVHDVDEERATSVVDLLATDDGQDHSTLVVDSTDPAAVKAAAEIVTDRYDAVDILITNLGYAENKGVFAEEIDLW